MPMTKSTLLGGDCIGRLESTTRTSWIANNAIPDSIITKMICRNLLPPVEPKVRSTLRPLISKNTLRILNTIKPVIRVFTAMDAAKPVRTTGSSQAVVEEWPCTSVVEPADASQVASRGDKLKSVYQMEMDSSWLT